MKLPEEYCQNMQELLGDEYEAYLAALDEKPFNGIRINNKKVSVDEMDAFLEREHFSEGLNTEKIQWIKNGYYINEVAKASSHPYYRAGVYYIQDPSAMTPAENLPIDPDDKVLDICAAPGGKASQLGACLSKDGFLLANDISAARCRILVRNLEMAGIDNFCVTAEDPQKLSEYYPCYFDKILLDAPCSGEGMFRKDPQMVRTWIDKRPKDYFELQYSLLEAADKMLKPGGKMIYSTCTFSPLEDEDNIKRFLVEHENYKLIRIPLFDGFTGGREGAPEAVRLYPHKLKGEGHFVCLLEKAEDTKICKSDANLKIKKNKKGSTLKEIKNEKLPESFKKFIKNCSYDFSNGRFLTDGDRLFFLNENVSVIEGLRYVRTGLLLGKLIKDRFEPVQAFAMALKKEEYEGTLDLPSDSLYVYKYLKGESFSISDDLLFKYSDNDKVSWQLICTDGFPLGWAKLSGSMLKNKYEPSLRMN